MRIAIQECAFLVVCALAFSAADAAAEETAATGIFAGHGTVKAVAPGTGWLTLDHDAIKGFMCAMEMMFKVESPELSKDLRPGDVVDFKIDAEKYVIVDVNLVAHAKQGVRPGDSASFDR